MVRAMRIYLSIVALLFVSSAHGAGVLVTDDAGVGNAGDCQLDARYKWQHRFHEHELTVIPACAPWDGVELGAGGTWADSAQPGSSQVSVLQVKARMVRLETNRAGLALSAGIGRVRPFQSPRVTNAYLNVIGSVSRLDDQLLLHANLGMLHDRSAERSLGTWGLAAEAQLLPPRLAGFVELYGQSAEKPTFQAGMRWWLVRERLQLDWSAGRQHSAPPERHFSAAALRYFW